jgi:hypothetical protein
MFQDATLVVFAMVLPWRKVGTPQLSLYYAQAYNTQRRAIAEQQDLHAAAL